MTLDAKAAHYVRDVMRCKVGERIALFNGRDGEWEAEIISLGKKQAEMLPVVQRRAQQVEPDIWLVFAPIKHGRIDYLAQKATELGASALLPVMTQHTMVSRVNEERLLANAVEAAEQSERLTVPVVHAPQKLETLLAGWKSDERTLIWCDEGGSGVPVAALAEKLGDADKLALLIGPEGGFSAAERRRIAQVPGAVAIGLGPRVMRADTAAIAALACIQSQWGDWDAPPAFRSDD